LFGGQPIPSHNVAHIGEVPNRIEIDDRHCRPLAFFLDIGNLFGKVADDEDFSPTGPLVVERACADDPDLEGFQY